MFFAQFSMRSALVLVTLLAAIRTTEAAPQSMVLVDRVLAEAERETPDISMLTTEPVARTQSSGYGWREDPINRRAKFHHGTDYRGKRGTPVVAAGAGTVVFAGRRGGYGRTVFVDHGNGVITRYGHLNKILVKEGETIAAGTQLGELGSSGRATGVHLHFEVRLAGRSVDPVTAMIVAEVWRENPGAGRLAAYALAPELMALSRDADSPELPPERIGRAKRQQVLW
jgi:murein DD-endopeptidase MepM/ murein hydrolase activator NlpD